MDTTLKNKLIEVFSNHNFNNSDAKFITDVLDEIDNRQTMKFEANKDMYLTQRDKIDIIDRINVVNDRVNSLNRTIYITNLVQYLAIIGSILAILQFR